MKFTSIPDNYSLLSEGLVYEVELGEVRDKADLSIIDLSHEKVVATLRFTQTSRISVDIGPYVRRMFTPSPSAGATESQTEADRTVAVAVAVDGARCDVRLFSLFTLDGLPRLLTAMPENRTLATGEFDEVAFYPVGGGRITIGYDNGNGESVRLIKIEPNARIGVLRINADDFPSAEKGLKVIFESGGRVEKLFYERVRRTPDAVRLAWIASTGAIEYYTFPTSRKRTLKTSKSRIYGSEGYLVTAAEGEATVVAVSDFEPAAVIDVLDEILGSPGVWRVEGDKFTKVDIVSSETLRRFDGSLNSLTVEFRTCKREEGLL